MSGMTSLLLLLWVGVTVSTVMDKEGAVIQDKTCSDNERLYHVELIDSQEKVVCGGSLISKQWILTAAHCWVWAMSAVLSVHPQSQKPIKMEITEPPVMFTDKNKIHDLMLLKLERETLIAPAKLPDCGKKDKKPIKSDKVQIAASSADPNSDEKKDSNPLQCVKISVEDCPWKRDHSTAFYAEKYQHMFCGKSDKVKICSGVSGGGVMYNDCIYGVISYIKQKDCTDSVGFVDVCEYKNWIEEKINDKKIFGFRLPKIG